jgi:serine/threonine protein kinase/pimeloyl-ACP methyl ester carboxylesterase
MSSVAGRPPGGRRLGDFEIIREVGRGGMGVVYEARQVSLNRLVALKVLGLGLGLTPHAVQRFRHEAEAAAKLHHTNIVPVYATGEQDGTHFYAMELIEGLSLDRALTQLNQGSADRPPPEAVTSSPPELVQTGPYVQGGGATGPASELSASSLGSGSGYFDAVARMVAEVADALEYAHRHGVIHRDIKPANLLLSPDGRLAVNDFGLARLLEQPGMTMTGEFIGTPAYMSPEQITAGRTPLDHRTDIYSLGATLYEMLTLRRPFAGERRDQVLAQILHKEPVPPRKLNRKVPVDLETICLKCLDKDPDRRYPTAKALADDLRRHLNRFAIAAKRAGPLTRLGKLVRRHKLVTAAGAVIVLLATAAGIALELYQRARGRAEKVERIAEERRQINWAHDQIPAIEAHIQAQRYHHAFDLLQQVEAILPEDPRLAGLRTECSWELSILTDPPGATVSRAPPDGPAERWEQLGVTPINNQRMPLGLYHWKFEKPGYATAESLADDAFLRVLRSDTGGAFRVELDRAKVAPRDMVRVRQVPPPLRALGPSVSIPQFWMDCFEVTNRQFKAFVDADGYRRQEFWEHPLEKDGKALSWEEAMALFRDTTDRPGPATWALGSYPDGQDEFPVAGVSWYEAAAFAKFAGKRLPTVHHWDGASGRGSHGGAIIPRSNIGRAGLAEVGRYRGLGPFGTYDMAGNVKEWCFNSAGDGKRYILGGAWDERDPMFWGNDTRAATDRGKNMGFRCVKDLPGQAPPQEAFSEVRRTTFRDYSAEKTMSDDAFQVVKGYFAYDTAKPLNAVVERREETASWVHERVTVDAVYGTERLIVHLFLPREATPPYQPVIYWPTGGARVVWAVVSPTDEYLAFLIKSGRALVCPIYKGTYERKVQPPGTAWQWEYFVQQTKDLSRAIDYLETRGDLNAGAVGYYGVSWGASDAVRALAVEGRIKAAVLADGGLNSNPSFERPERDLVHYLPRITIPVLMLNGRYDSGFTPKGSQEPMFRLLGTDSAHKRHSLSDSSHIAAPSPERIQETVSWFDLYLGPVRPKGSPAVTPD